MITFLMLCCATLGQVAEPAARPPVPPDVSQQWTFDVTTTGDDIVWTSPTAVDPTAMRYHASVDVQRIELGVNWDGVEYPLTDVTNKAPPGSLSAEGELVGPAPFTALDETITIPQKPQATVFRAALRVRMNQAGFVTLSARDLVVNLLPVDMGRPLGIQQVEIREVRVQGVMRIDGTWFDLGESLVAAKTPPRLEGEGNLAPGSPGSIALRNAKPGVATLVTSLKRMSSPFKGGVMVPAPDLLLTFAVSQGGSVEVPFTWPQGVPGRTEVYMQFWVPDPAGPVGFTASNAIKGITP